MFYLDLFHALDQHGVDYLLIGGLAMNLHGVPRMTMDVDIVLALDGENLTRFIACATELGLTPQAPVPLAALADPAQRREWIETKKLIAFALNSTVAGTPTLDVLLVHPLDVAQSLGRAEVRAVDGIPVRLAAIEDMIRLKQAAGRRQDLDDIANLQRLRHES